MKQKNIVEVNGVVTQSLPNTMFRIDLTDGKSILATLTGKMRRAYVRIFPGDRVRVEMTPYDENHGRINYKY